MFGLTRFGAVLALACLASGCASNFGTIVSERAARANIAYMRATVSAPAPTGLVNYCLRDPDGCGHQQLDRDAAVVDLVTGDISPGAGGGLFAALLQARIEDVRAEAPQSQMGGAATVETTSGDKGQEPAQSVFGSLLQAKIEDAGAAAEDAQDAAKVADTSSIDLAAEGAVEEIVVEAHRPVRNAAFLTTDKWNSLVAINAAANRAIRPMTDQALYGVPDFWTRPIAPLNAGDCEDYALEKRARLLEAGWSADYLSIVTAISPTAGYHAVLLVSTTDGDFVLDNLEPAPRRLEDVRYQWVSMQRGSDMLHWAVAQVEHRGPSDPFLIFAQALVPLPDAFLDLPVAVADVSLLPESPALLLPKKSKKRRAYARMRPLI